MALGDQTGTTGPDRPVVLIGFGEAFAAIEAAWSLQAAGFKVAAFHRSGSRPALRRVRDVDLYDVPSPERDAGATVAGVRELIEAFAPTALMPLDDHSVWVCDRLKAAAVPLAGATGPAAELALDKTLQLEAALQAGLPVPPTQVLDDLTGVRPEGFPLMVKPGRALYEVGGALARPTGVVCADSEELKHAMAKQWPGCVHVQPLIQGVGEGLFGHVGAQGVIGWSAHRRVRMVNPQGSASSACRSIPVDRQLTEPAERFLSSVAWRGMFMLEFLRDSDGKPWFMELNGRPWGSMALARRRGFEYPAWAVRASLDPSFEPTPPADAPEILCRNLGLELAHLMFVARGPQSAAPMAWPRMGRAVRDVCRFGRGDRLYNWNRSQPGVLVADTFGTLAHYTRRMLRKRR